MSNLMLLPSLGCAGQGNYCFGPRDDGEEMSMQTLDAVLIVSVA
jgi:hypothetical protein